MIESGSYARSMPTRKWIGKSHFTGFVTDLIGSRERSDQPQAYLVEQPAGFKLQQHFHLRHQFQVVVSGGGTLGVHEVGPLTVHYASAHAGYGPLEAGSNGLWYLTLRAHCDSTTAWFLPESRERMKRGGPEQQSYGIPSSQVSAGQLKALTQSQQEVLIALDEGGLGAWLIRVPPRQSICLPDGSEAGGGRFVILTQGSLVLGDNKIDGLATIYADPNDELDSHAGEAGAEIVVVQYPAVALQEVTAQEP